MEIFLNISGTIAVCVLLTAIVIFFIRLLIKSKSYGSSFNTTVVGATYDLLSQDKRRAAEVQIESEAGKKMEEQSSEEPDDTDSL